MIYEAILSCQHFVFILNSELQVDVWSWKIYSKGMAEDFAITGRNIIMKMGNMASGTEHNAVNARNINSAA